MYTNLDLIFEQATCWIHDLFSKPRKGPASLERLPVSPLYSPHVQNFPAVPVPADSPITGYSGFVQFRLARETEDAGFGGVYIPEAVNDALMCSFAVANATRRINIATWIVNIYLREPALCAISAEMVQDAAQGRFILGLGVSHRPALEARGIEMGNARDRLRRDTEVIRKAFRGELDMFGMKFPSLPRPIPIPNLLRGARARDLEARWRAGGRSDALHVKLANGRGLVAKSIDAANQVARDPRPVRRAALTMSVRGSGIST